MKSLEKSCLLLALLAPQTSGQNFSVAGTPFATLGCGNSVPGDASWIWQAGSGTWQSCNLAVRGDIGSMCVDAAGKADPTSLFVSLPSTPDRSGCFAWTAEACSVDFRRVQRIEFDFDVASCGSVWAAPLWISPRPWDGPAPTSGEVDFVEACPVGDLRTNFATGGTEESIGNPDNLGGPKHLIMTLDNSAAVGAAGTLRTKICDLGPTNCRDSAFYPDYMSTVISTRGQGHSFPYIFLSDIWNGFGGDSGWTGCKAGNNPNSACQYAVRNIRVYTDDGSPMFSGKCAALNGIADTPAEQSEATETEMTEIVV